MSLSADDEGLAAEFALGTLDAAERATVAARRQREPELDAAISAWEGRLSPLAEAAPEAAPPPGLFERIKARLDAPASAVDLSDVLQARLQRWRAATAGAGMLAAGLAAALAFVVTTRPVVPHQFVAVLQKGPDEPAFAMTVDIDKQEFSVRPVSAPAPVGKSYELWIIAPKLGAPKSLGVIDVRAVSRDRPLSAYDRGTVEGATYAVTLEPEGGSPDGKPSGAPVFAGKLIPVGP
jgi:anti-sigma-K factor RskA